MIVIADEAAGKHNQQHAASIDDRLKLATFASGTPRRAVRIELNTTAQPRANPLPLLAGATLPRRLLAQFTPAPPVLAAVSVTSL